MGPVVHNKALLGVVNSRESHFRAGAEWLSDTPEAVLDELVIGVYGPEEIDRAFEDSDETMKSVVSFNQLDPDSNHDWL